MNDQHLQLAVCDYPEHVPQDRWADYARQQKALGLSYVRIAEFAWALMEPHPGQYEWAWLDQAIEATSAAGLKVVLCTPTATPPAWLARQYPEILPFDREGRVREFGSRRHYDFASPVYREHSRRITRAMAERYGHHEALAGWQTDNEFGCHDTARSWGGASAAAFPGWLEAKYRTLDALNTAWGNVFWSMDYQSWDQIKPPNLLVTEVNPSHLLDFYRFSSDNVQSFQQEQLDILRELSPGRFITHNFMIFDSGFDHYAVAGTFEKGGLDFVSWDNYPTGMLEFFSGWGSDDLKTRYARTGHPDFISFNHDLYRGLLHRPFWVMEQQCGQVNWAPYNPLPADGAVGLWTMQAWAHGADTVSYFRWRAATMSQEVMHSGLLRHDETPDRGHHEIAGFRLEDFPLGAVQAKVALLHDYESLWLYDVQKHAASLSYWAQMVTYYAALRGLGQDVDIVHPASDLSGYALIVAPALTLMTPEWAAHLEQAAGHARIVFGPRSAYRTPSGRTPEDGQPGVLAGLLGCKLLNFDSLRPGLSVRVQGPDHACDVQSWAESYRVLQPHQGADVIYHYVDGPQHGKAAVVRNGNVTVIGAHSEELIERILAGELKAAGMPVEKLPEGVRLSRRAGQTLVQNWNELPVLYRGETLHPVSFEVRRD